MANEYPNFFRVRRILDSFETMTLAYYRQAKDFEESEARFKWIEDNFHKPVDDLRVKLIELNGKSEESKSHGEALRCPRDAPYRCDNYCVPNPCIYSND